MGLYQPTVITPSSLNGTGVIDATKDMTVTWQINGTVPILYWQFVIMQNDNDSTVLYESDWRFNYIEALDPISGETIRIPVYTFGRDQGGNLIPTTDTISASDLENAGVVNNYANGYKLKVNQRYEVYTSPTQSTLGTLEQISPVFFKAIDVPEIDTTGWSNTAGRYKQFDLHLISSIPHYREMYDPIIFKRQRLAYASDPENNIIEDSGDIYLPSYNDSLHHFDSEIVYGILENHTQYAFRMDVQLESGLEISSGWVEFGTAWNDTALDYVHLRAYYVRNTPAIFLRMEVDEGYDEGIVKNLPPYQRWTIYRIRTDTGEREKVGIIPNGQTGIYDFGARNNTEYKYRAYYGLGNEDGYMYETDNAIKMKQYWDWAVIETEKIPGYGYYLANHSYRNDMYHIKRVFQFQGNVESGSVTNDNKPNVQDNFTPYPTVQKSSRKGLSGTLKAWVGRVRNAKFKDSIEEIDRIMDLSTSETVKFLRDRKGNIRMIEIGDPIRKETQDTYAEQPVAIELPWVEVGDASKCQIVSMLNDGVIIPGDDIIDTDTAIIQGIAQDGYILWNIHDDSNYLGSDISMDENGNLVQEYDDSMTYVPAELQIENGELKGTTSEDE